MPAAVGVVVVVAPGSILLIFSGVCVTVPTAPVFSDAPACSCCVPSKFIVFLCNESVTFFNLMLYNSSDHQGLGVLGLGVMWGGVLCFFCLVYSCTDECPLIILFLSMCFSWLGLQLVVVTSWVHNLLF